MKIETLTIREYMDIVLITDTFKDDEKKYQKKMIEYFDGSLDVPIDVSGETLFTLDKVLHDKTDLITRFKINGTEFGLIPNFEKMATGAYIDLDEYLKEGSYIDRIMSILYRPIIEQKGDKYKIEKYNGTDNKYVETMQMVDFKVFKAVLVFFSLLRKSLLNASDIFTKKQEKREKPQNQ